MNHLDLKLLDRIFKLARKRGVSRLSLNDGQLEIGFELSEHEESQADGPHTVEDDAKPDAPPAYTDEQILMWSSGLDVSQPEDEAQE